MDASKELKKWMEDFRNCNTPEQKADHSKRFNTFLSTLNEEDRKAFAKVFTQKSHEAIVTAKALIKEINIKND